MYTIIRFDELDSTNTYAKTNFDSLENFSVITAVRQTAGRGRYKRVWVSQEGGLYFSVVLKMQQYEYTANLTQLMALSVCKTLQRLGVNATIKWPNDVLAHGRKVCGILSEALAADGTIKGLVVGAGINVAQPDLLQVDKPAVSLNALGLAVEVEVLLKAVLDVFFEHYPSVLKNGFEAIGKDYRENFPYIGKEVSVLDGQKVTAGVVQSISPEGRLMLQTADGLKEISIGDMTP